VARKDQKAIFHRRTNGSNTKKQFFIVEPTVLTPKSNFSS